MRKLLALLLVAVLCGAAASAADNVVKVHIAHDNHPGDPLTRAAEYWAKILGERSGGTMVMECFPSGQLGSKNDLLDQMFAGDPILVVANGPFCADRGVPDLAVTQAPYLFENWDQIEKMVFSDWWKEQSAKLEKIGMKIVGENWQYGTRHTLTTKKVAHPADFKGMKIRTQPSSIHVKGFTVLGAIATPMTLTEVYTSLQQGTIEGLENPLSVLYSGKFHEVAKYLVLDGHIRDVSFVVCGVDFYNTLTPEQQKLLYDTGREAGEYQNKLARQADIDCLEKFKKEGVTVTEVDFNEFREAAKPFYSDPDVIGKWSPGLVDRINAIIK